MFIMKRSTPAFPSLTITLSALHSKQTCMFRIPLQDGTTMHDLWPLTMLDPSTPEPPKHQPYERIVLSTLRSQIWATEGTAPMRLYLTRTRRFKASVNLAVRSISHPETSFPRSHESRSSVPNPHGPLVWAPNSETS